MPRFTRAQHLAESEAARRMYALNQTRDAGPAGGPNADFQSNDSNQGQVRRSRSEDDPDGPARRPSPFLAPDEVGRDSMDFNPPPDERGRESGGVPEEEVPPSSDEDDSDYSPGHTHHSQSSVSNHSYYESDFDDRDYILPDEEVDLEEMGRGRRRINREASDQRRFLESDDSSDEDYAPSRSLERRSESLMPTSSVAGSRASHHTRRSGSVDSRHSSRPHSRHSSRRHESLQPSLNHSSRRPESRQPSFRSVSRQSSRHPVSRHSSRRPTSPHSSRHPTSHYSPQTSVTVVSDEGETRRLKRTQISTIVIVVSVIRPWLEDIVTIFQVINLPWMMTGMQRSIDIEA
ncbi:hypothetical protein EV361DRAFT_959589 [Lentinula raphanica]|nr:hypothetical protein EV361DRAFT_959589 [Lentinula raphanica]